MRPKTKIILSAISLVLVFTLGIVGVFALTQINTDAKLRVKFVGSPNVYATIKASSYVSSQEAPVETLRPLVINGDEDELFEGSLAFSKLIEVTQSETVDYVFEIENTTEVVTKPELIIEPIVDISDDFATWTIYYLSDIDVGYKQLNNIHGTGDNYTYIELGKNEIVRVRLSINSTNSEEDVNIDGANLSFRLYAPQSAPEDYEEDSVAITGSHLYYDIGDTVTLGEFPQSYVGNELNEILVDEMVKLDSGEESLLTVVGSHTSGLGYELVVYRYEVDGERYIDNEMSFYKYEPVEFTVVETDGDSATLLSNSILEVLDTNYANNTKSCDWVGEDMGINNILLTTSVDNYNFKGVYLNTMECKMWLPLSTEIEEWASVLGDDIKISKYTGNVDPSSYLLRDDSYDSEAGEYSLLYINSSGNLVAEGVYSEGEEPGSYLESIRPVCRIAQLNYKGF